MPKATTLMQVGTPAAQAVEISKVCEYSNDNIAAGASPTDAECETAFGTAAAAGAGYAGIIDDNGAGSTMVLVLSDGTNWFYTAMTKAA